MEKQKFKAHKIKQVINYGDKETKNFRLWIQDGNTDISYHRVKELKTETKQRKGYTVFTITGKTKGVSGERRFEVKFFIDTEEDKKEGEN